MKKIFIIISIIVIALAIVCSVILKNRKPVEPVAPVQIEHVEQKQPEVVKPKTEQKEPVMRDENDMPKSDINVPEIG